MNDKQKIAGLVSGGLSDSEKSEILHKISIDDNLAEDFKTHLNIHKSVKQNADRITAPRDLKQSIMNKTIHKPRYLSPLFSYLLAGIGGITVLMLLLFFLTNNGDDNNPALQDSRSNVASNSTAMIVDIENTNEGHTGSVSINKTDIPVVSSVSLDNNIKTDNLSQKIDNSSAEKDKITNITKIADIRRIELTSFQQQTSTPIFSVNNNLNNERVSQSDYRIYDLSSFDNKLFAIEVNSNNDFHLPDATIEPAEQMSMNNTSFAISYNFSENWAVSIDYRRENFFQIFSGTDPVDGALKEYRQQPNFNMYGIYAKYKNKLFGNFYYISQAGLAFSGPGIAGRLRLGLNFELVDNLGISLSGEYSQMYFMHQNDYFNSKKFGIHYGLYYSF